MNAPWDVAYEAGTQSVAIAITYQHVAVRASDEGVVTVIAGNGSSTQGPDFALDARQTSLVSPVCIAVYRGTLDDPTGLVHVKDVLARLNAEEDCYRLTPSTIAQLRRPILFAPPSMRALDLLLRCSRPILILRW